MALFSGVALGLFGPRSAEPQTWICEIIGNLVQSRKRVPDSCYDGSAWINTKAIAKIATWVDKPSSSYALVAVIYLHGRINRKPSLNLRGA